MSRPIEWREKVCKLCGAVVATESESVTKKWSDGSSEPELRQVDINGN